MKKFVGIFMVLIMMLVSYESLADVIIHNANGSEVQCWVEEWCNSQGYEDFTKRDRGEYEISNGYCKTYGVIDNDAFELTYGTDFDKEYVVDLLYSIYDEIDVTIDLIGFYEGYEVYMMTAESRHDVIGWTYWEGEEIPYYNGAIIFMVFSRN